MSAAFRTHHRLASPAPPLQREGRGFLVAASLAVGFFCTLPTLRLFIEPLRSLSGAGIGDTLGEFARPAVLAAILNTLETGVASALLALAIGTAAALAIATTDMRGKRAFAFLFAMSMLVAPHVVALAFKTFAGPASPLLGLFGLNPPPGTPNPVMGRGGIILVLGLHHAPLAMLILLSGLKGLPHALVEAAGMDGAGPARMTRDVILPVLRGHLVAAGLLAFVAAIGNFGIPALLGLPVNYVTLPTLIYRRMTSFGPGVIGDVALYSILLAGLAGLAVIIAGRLLARPAVILAREAPLRPYWRLGFARGMLETAAVLLVAVVVLVPAGSLLASALVPALGVPLTWATVTPDPFVEVLFRQAASVRAFANSFLFSALAALGIAVIALPLAYAVERQAGRWRGPLRFFIELPYALPGVVIAIAAILLFLRPIPLLNVSLYGTAFIILFAYLARFLSLGLKPVVAAMRQFDPAIEEAGALCGATFGTRMRTLLLPTLLPAITAGALFVFLTAFNELTVSALLWSAGTRTLGVVLFSFEEAGLTSLASALGFTTLVLVAVLMLAIEAMEDRLPPGAVPWSLR